MESVMFNFRGFHANQYFYVPVINTPEVTEILTYLPVQKHGSKLGYISELSGILRETMDCEIPEYKGFEVANRCVNLRPVGFKIPFCTKKLEGTVFAELLSAGVDVRNVDLAAPVLKEMIMRQVEQAVKNDVVGLAIWGSPGISDPFWRLFEGIWAHWIEELATGGVNALASGWAALVSPGDGTSGDNLNRLYDQSNERLKSITDQSNLQYLASPLAFDALRHDLNALSQPATGEARFRDGTYMGARLEWNGLTVVRDTAQARAIEAGVATDRRNAVLYDKRNFVAMTDARDHSSQIMAWYSMDKNKYYVQGEFLMDVNLIHPTLYKAGRLN
jgi:hypothetical protein